MLPSNRNSGHRKNLEEQLFQNLNSFESDFRTKTHKNDNTKKTNAIRKKSLIDLKGEFNLIDFSDDFLVISGQVANRKVPQNTLDDNTQMLTNLTPEKETELNQFLDKYDTNSKSYLNNTEIKSNACSSYFELNDMETPKVLIPKLEVLDIEEDLKVDEDLIDEVLLEKSLENLRSPTNFSNFNSEDKLCSQYSEKNNVDKEDIMKKIAATNLLYLTPKLNETNFLTPTKISNNMSNQSIHTKSKNDDSKCHRNDINYLVTAHDIRYLEAVKKEEKVFQKRSVLKTETEKSLLTPGPTLKEKSLVLPQMMQRLKERKQAVEYKKNITKRLVHDSGSSRNNTNVNKKTEVPVNNKSNLKEKTEFQNKFFAEVPTHTNGVPEKIKMASQTSIYPSVEMLRAKRRELYKESSLKPEEIMNNLPPPEVLTRDCNRERFIKYATSRLFDDFIRYGN